MITKIESYWIVYKKDGVLHDLAIERIKRIDLENGTEAVYLDKENKARILNKSDEGK